MQLVRLGRTRLVLLLLRVLVPRPRVAAGCSESHLPLLVLNLPALALGVEGSINQLVEVVKAVVQERILNVIIQSLPEVLLLVAISSDVTRGIASKLEEAVTVLHHCHSKRHTCQLFQNQLTQNSHEKNFPKYPKLVKVTKP